MRITRIHLPPPLAAGQLHDLPADAREHLVRVLRLRVGDRLEAFDGEGRAFMAELADLGRRSARVRLLEPVQTLAESPLQITLAQGIARGDKMDFILQKATELGVATIVPLVTRRTEVKLDGERLHRRMAHWQGVIAAACGQCGRSRMPALQAPQPLAHWAAGVKPDPAGLRLVLDPQGQHRAGELPAGAHLTLAIGPEGGLDERDHHLLEAAGFQGLRLGPRILRTETAGLAAIAILQALHGDLG